MSGERSAQVRIDDNGPGIAPEDRRRVLERFNRGRATDDAADRSPGIGLGLAIVAEIVRAHEGSVSIVSGSSGQGVCVVIDLPLANLT